MLKLGAFYQQLLAEVGHLGALSVVGPHVLSAGLMEMSQMIWTVLRSRSFLGMPCDTRGGHARCASGSLPSEC